MTPINPYLDAVTIENREIRLVISPRLGASVITFERIDADRPIEIFRRTSEAISSALECAMPIMLPWVNRISSGGIPVAGRFHPIKPNIPGEPFPNHGNGFQSQWHVLDQSPSATTMALGSDGPGPYAYEAKYHISLSGPSLLARIEVTNRSTRHLPFGIGLHPWLPRTPGTTLAAMASEVWLEDERYIPTESVHLDRMPDFDFRTARRLPGRWINNSFVGWNGLAKIIWPKRHLKLAISSPDARCYHVYSPGEQADFFCFETETHIPDAARLLPPGCMGAPAWLGPGQALVHEARFEVMAQPLAARSNGGN